MDRSNEPSRGLMDNIVLERTCFACPEQYEAFLNGEQVGYLRLRHGFFRVDCPDCGDETVFEAEPKGDGLFEDEEREAYLLQAKTAIAAWIENQQRL